MGIEEFQQDLRDGMSLEKALTKHNLSFKEAVDVVHKPITKSIRKRKPYHKRNLYRNVDKNIAQRGDAFYLRKLINGKHTWGGSYNTLEEALKVRNYLDEHGWNLINVNEACRKFGIERRRR